MESKTPTPDTKISARRRLLQGSFSVPAVLTLASGSALADNSATCMAKATAVTKTAELKTGASADTFLRAELLAYTENLVTRYALTRASFNGIPVNSAFWGSGVVWQEFDIANNTLIGTQHTDGVPGSTARSNYYVALRLNGKGEIVGAGLSGGGSVVGQSCWNSFKLAPP